MLRIDRKGQLIMAESLSEPVVTNVKMPTTP